MKKQQKRLTVGSSLEKYACNLCNYFTKKKGDYEKHCITNKHIRYTNKLSCANADNNMNLFVCECCKKTYLHKQSYYRHVNGCNIGNTISELHKQTDELKQTLNTIIQEIKTPNQTIVNNTVNKLNINLYLNTECKDAMNITDFVHNIKLSPQALPDTSGSFLETSFVREKK